MEVLYSVFRCLLSELDKHSWIMPFLCFLMFVGEKFKNIVIFDYPVTLSTDQYLICDILHFIEHKMCENLVLTNDIG